MDLGPAVSLIVEDEPLQMDDQGVGQTVDVLVPTDVPFLLALLAEVVRNALALDEVIQTLVNTFVMLHLEGNIEEVLNAIDGCLAALACYRRYRLSSKDILQNLLKWCLLQLFLQAIEQDVHELLRVLLNRQIDVTPETVAELLRVVVSTFAQLQEGKQLLQLI